MDIKDQLEIQAMYAQQAAGQAGNPAPALDLPEAPRSSAEVIAAEGEGQGDGDLTREGIAKMAKADVLELLEVHGVEGATGTVAELRAQLVSVMFVEA